MPVADERERLPAGQLLVAGLEVDRRKRRTSARVVVEVPTVDVDPHAAELVDRVDEAAVVDRDEVVDRNAAQPPHRLQRSLEAALRVGGVDRREERRASRAVDVDQEVARKGDHRERRQRRVGSHEDDRVGTPASLLLGGPAACVLADDQRDRRPVRKRNVQLVRGLADVGVAPRDAVDLDDRLLTLEPVAAGDADEEGDRAEHEEHQDAAEDPDDAAPLARLLVARDRRQAGWR